MPQRRHVARAALTAAAATACLTFATPAWASSTAPLHPGHVGSTAAGFGTQQCGDEKFDGLPAGHDGWHFVLPTNKAGNFESLTLTFKNSAGSTVTVKVPDSTDPYTDFLSGNGGGDKQVKHAYLFTPAGWKLTGGSATISGQADKFNLSHTCAGTGTGASQSPGTPATPTTPGGSVNPSESTPSSSSTSPSAGNGGNGGSGG
ncbi:hypothetical protein, partial [Micromonospora psammae]